MQEICILGMNQFNITTMKKSLSILGLFLGLASLSFGQDWNYTPISGTYPYGKLVNFANRVYLPYTNGNNYIRPGTPSHYTYFDSGSGVGMGHQGQYPGYQLHVHGKTNLNGDVGIRIGNTAPSSTLDVNGTGHYSGSLGVGTAVSAMNRVSIQTDNSRGLFVFSSDWDHGHGAEIWAGSIGLTSIAGAYHTTGTQPLTTYGVWGVSVLGTTLSCGVHGDATSEPTGVAYGVWGTAMGSGPANYAIYGTGTGGPGVYYAGYFAGNVYSTGLYLGSDRKLKENIKTLNKTERLMLLEPKEYTFKTAEYSRMNLEEGVQMGFIAQDIEKVFPELVKETIQPATLDDEGNVIEESVSFKAVNYVGLIPILTATVQEQNLKLEQQNEVIDELKDRLARLENSMNVDGQEYNSEAVLFQNSPNPFNETTVIKYSLPLSAESANIIFFDLNGTHHITIKAEVSADGRIILNARELSPGMYIYALVVDGKEVASKRLIVTE